MNKVKGTEPKINIPRGGDPKKGRRRTKLGVEDTDAKDRKDEGCQKPEAPATKDWLNNGEVPYGSKREETTKIHRHIRKAMIFIAISILAVSYTHLTLPTKRIV